MIFKESFLYNNFNNIYESNTSTNKEIILIGIGGPSPCGKSTIASRLAKHLNSPFLPIKGDIFFKDRSEIPKHEKYGLNREIPEAMDFNSFYRELVSLKNHSLTCQDLKFPFNLQLEKFKIPINSNFYEEHISTCLVFIVVESYLLYYDKKIWNLIDIPLFIECDRDICLERKKKRTKSGKFSSKWFTELVWPNYLKYFDNQLENAKPKIFDGREEDKDTLLNEILEYLNDKLNILKSSIFIKNKSLNESNATEKTIPN